MKPEPTIKTIKTITIKRKVEETYTATRMVNRDVNVELTDLTDEDIYSLDKELLQATAIAFRKLYLEYKSIAVEQNGMINFITPEEPEPPLIPIAIESIEDETDAIMPVEIKTPVTEQPRHHSGGSGVVGAKHGVTSKYHYVFWDNTKKKWCNTFTSDSFDNEDECALFVNKYLDSTNDDKRPRNIVRGNDEAS